MCPYALGDSAVGWGPNIWEAEGGGVGSGGVPGV